MAIVRLTLLFFLIICVACDDYYDFIPLFEGTIKPDSPQVTWNSTCFTKNIAKLLNVSAAGASVSLSTSNRSSILCIEYYIFATREQLRFEAIFEENHIFSFSGWTEEEYSDVLVNGIQIFNVKEHILGSLKGIWETYQLFRATKNTPEENIRFLEDRMNLTIKPRTTGFIDLPLSSFHSGDQLALFLPVGNDVLIMWGSGSRTTHHAVLLWDAGELYVCESCSSTCLGSVQGVQRTLWSEWVPKAIAKGLSVAFLPLDPVLSSQFNETAALEYFQSVDGLPYGFHNFFFGWIDTPDANYPPPLNFELVAILLPVLDKLDHNITSRVFGEPLAQRLGLPLGSEISDIYAVLQQKNLSLGDVIALPEQDNWVYSDGRSIVCDVLWVEMLKAAGTFGNLTSLIAATEFTPVDAYQLKVFDSAYQVPAPCQVDGLPYCQLFGPYLLELPGWNTIPPYARMNERCPTIPPNYDRLQGC